MNDDTTDNHQQLTTNNQPSISILGCGWLGLPFGAFMVEKGYTVKGSTTSEEKLATLESKGIEPFLLRASAKTFQGEGLSRFFEADILVLNIPPRRRRDNVEEAHQQEMRHIIQAAESGTIQRILFISSTGVYGNENRIMTEMDITNPTRSSSKALVQVEKELQQLPGIQTTILRMAGLVGGDRKAGRFLAGRKAIKNGDAPVNMVHRDDCIQIMYEMIQQQRWGELFNVCADEHPTRKDFYTAQAKKEGLEPPTFAETDALSYKIITNQKLKNTLGYEFLHPDSMDF